MEPPIVLMIVIRSWLNWANNFIENNLTRVQLEMELAIEELNAYPSMAEAMTNIVSEIFN